MTLRIILTEADIRKVKLTSKPGSVEELISCLKNTLRLDYNFTLQFQDPEFDNELCNLTILSELPQKPTVKIIPVIELVPLSSGEMETSSDMLSDAPSTADTVLTLELPQEKRIPWPDIFLTPKFSVDVEFRLRQTNLIYLKDGTHIKVTKELKHDILQKLAETIYSCKAYPTTEDLRAVAKALVNTHPCLQEPGSPSGYCGWTNSLKDKMGNYRSKMRSLGHTDVMVNAGKRRRYSTSSDPPNKNIKKPRKGEVNYLPDLPDGQDASSLEMLRQQLADEMKRKNPDAIFINQKMDMTLSLRRKDVVINKPPVSQILQCWPALFRESQVYQELSRVVGKNLKQELYGSLDRHCPQLIQIFRSKRGLAGQILSDLLQQAKTSDIADMLFVAMRGLPVLLGDDQTKFFKACFASDDGDSYQHVPVGILSLENEDVALQPMSLRLHPSSVGIILEGNVVMDNLDNIPQAMCLLFGLTYALHLDYPKCMCNTFLFIQQVLLGLGKKELKGKILAVTNQLTM
ncbi:sterile alpha motif domain-containing protein 3-like [Cyprinus carpio]|uniref:Sterile alpha motif domain-containing protein 3-like n=1 Tax=Cyprinus carpio TaxID=7962 RepID=A0A9R0BBA6_CYPCA|nr:sterile alpha motif domain-containing protein 3-like [Cyprinus carpio]